MDFISLSISPSLYIGLTFEESTDIGCLERKLEECQKMVQSLKDSKQTRYAPRRQKEQLKNHLANKTKAKEHVSEKNLQLKARYKTKVYF